MCRSVVADSLLHIVDGHVLTGAVEFSQRGERSGETLAVQTVVSVAGTAVPLGGEGLAYGTQVVLKVHLNHLEDSLTELSLGCVVHFGGHVWGTAEPPLTDEERRLLVYIEKEESLRNYVAQLAVCRDAADVGKVVALMCEHEPHLSEVQVVKEEFIKTLLPFIRSVEKGRGIDNLRFQINNAWMERKRTLRNM